MNIRKAANGAAIVGLCLGLFGGCAWSNHVDAVPKCGDKVMQPGTVCQSLSGGTSSTYEELKQSMENSVPVDMALAFGGAGVFAAGLLTGQYARRKETAR
ncbi:hypothetical protein ACFXKW_31820 [Streptomyces sp. NPDC059193]|uniref:hypothetical protein n=1 Tax=Streptomyces sp. NPDC059193 TaxID=3346763 RepID=UPI0036C1DA98